MRVARQGWARRVTRVGNFKFTKKGGINRAPGLKKPYSGQNYPLSGSYCRGVFRVVTHGPLDDIVRFASSIFCPFFFLQKKNTLVNFVLFCVDSIGEGGILRLSEGEPFE